MKNLLHKTILLAISLFCLSHTAMAQTTIPTYTVNTFTAQTPHLNPHLVDIVKNRFAEIPNTEVHELVSLAAEQLTLTRASEARIFHQKMTAWKTKNLTASELSSMPEPTLRTAN